jgi:hypothetical protein
MTNASFGGQAVRPARLPIGVLHHKGGQKELRQRRANLAATFAASLSAATTNCFQRPAGLARRQADFRLASSQASARLPDFQGSGGGGQFCGRAQTKTQPRLSIFWRPHFASTRKRRRHISESVPSSQVSRSRPGWLTGRRRCWPVRIVTLAARRLSRPSTLVPCVSGRWLGGARRRSLSAASLSCERETENWPPQKHDYYDYGDYYDRRPQSLRCRGRAGHPALTSLLWATAMRNGHRRRHRSID